MTAPLVSTTDRPYQLLPPLTVEQRDLLRQSIKENGVLEPVVFDEDGEILDGHHRVEIAEELGIEYPRRVIEDLDRPGKHMYALTVNVARRQLDQSARSTLVAQMRIRGMSIRTIAKALGVSRGTVANDLAQVSKVGHLPEEITGADGKSYAASRPAPTQTPGPVEADAAPPADPDATTEPLPEHQISTAWKGDEPGSCGMECTCGTTYDDFDSLAEVEPHLLRHIELSAPHIKTPEPVTAPTVPVAGSGSTSPEPEPEPEHDGYCLNAGGECSPEVQQAPPAPKPTLTLVPDVDEERAAKRRDARALLVRVVELLSPTGGKPGYIETWARQLGPYDDELAALVQRAHDALAALDDLISEAGK